MKRDITFIVMFCVATTPTACGIETNRCDPLPCAPIMLQQHLPLAVLKHNVYCFIVPVNFRVATTPTACGIETKSNWCVTISRHWLQQHLPLAVLKHSTVTFAMYFGVVRCNNTYRLRYWNLYINKNTQEFLGKLQQHLPLAVLKLIKNWLFKIKQFIVLQQHLPLAVLKPVLQNLDNEELIASCNNTYRLRYWNVVKTIKIKCSKMLQQHLPLAVLKLSATASAFLVTSLQQHLPLAVLKRARTKIASIHTRRCNNTYRLRYAPKGARQQRSKATMRSAHLKYLNEEKVKQRR